jgi:hypothetical protein
MEEIDPLDYAKTKIMKRYYCTYFDRNYLVKGLAMIESLGRHEKNAYQLFVVCLDEITRTILNKLNLPNIALMPAHEIEQRDYALLAAKYNRSSVEYYWTLTPTVILRLLERHPYIAPFLFTNTAFRLTCAIWKYTGDTM